MTTIENKQIDLDQGVAEQINTLYRAKIKEELEGQWSQILAEQPEIIQKLLSFDDIKERFIEILTEEALKEAQELTKTTATLKYKGSSDNIY